MYHRTNPLFTQDWPPSGRKGSYSVAGMAPVSVDVLYMYTRKFCFVISNSCSFIS